MRERPILFSSSMVRAILDGRKHQTRRLVKPQPEEMPPAVQRVYGDDGWCPHGAPGDRLWVRETWGYRGSAWDSKRPGVQDVSIKYRADDVRLTFERAHDDTSGLPKQVCRCSGEGDDIDRRLEHDAELTRFWAAWRPSIYMPRWASRITLEVIGVRVERLQDISEEDALAEGARRWDLIPDPARERTPWGVGPRWSMFEPRDTDDCLGTARFAFGNAWDKINGDRAPWSSNPWVWCLTFRRVD